MSKKVSRIIGIIMLAAAVIFVIIALTHPEMSMPFNNGVTYAIYAIYAALTVLLLIAPFKKSGKI